MKRPVSFRLAHLFDPVDDGGEVVVQKNHRRCLFAGVAAADAHANAHVSTLQRWGIVNLAERFGNGDAHEW